MKTLTEKQDILFNAYLIKKHCFHNVNKRTAFMSLIYFLRINGLNFTMTTDEAVQLCVGVAT